MTVGVIPEAAETDPITAALNNPSVRTQLLDVAWACLAGRIFNIPSAQRGPEAEEIVQKAGLRAWEIRTHYDPNREVVCWLIGIVRNVAREHVKKYARGTTGPPSAPAELEDLVTDLGRPVGDAVADRAFAEGLLEQLPQPDREIVRLAYYEDLTFAEIGASVGLTEGAARLRHHRALDRLRELAGGTEEVQS